MPEPTPSFPPIRLPQQHDICCTAITKVEVLVAYSPCQSLPRIRLGRTGTLLFRLTDRRDGTVTAGDCRI